MNAQHLRRPSRSPAHPTATITAGWLGKFETLRAKLGCQYRGPSCFGSPLITTGAAITSTGELSRSAPSWCGRLGGSPLPPGPAHLDHPVPDLDLIPTQPPRDLVYRDAATEHLAQRVHLRIRPLSAGIHGQRFVICLGPPRIED